MSEGDLLRDRFAAAQWGEGSIEARVQRAGLLTRLFDDPPAPVRVDRFAIEQQVGEGGMGRVYSARDARLGRRVAIKVLHGGAHPQRLAAEARAMARINHPNVVQVFDVGTTDSGELYVAMEFVAGQTLQQWLQSTPTQAAVVDAFVQAGRGLAAAHEAGVLHRDFKPSNVLVAAQGVVKVTDFGLARSGAASPGPADRARLAGDLTQAGTVLGTPAYMAPEQWESGPVTAAADQFAFCVALFEALFGVRPRTYEGGASLRAQLEDVRGRAGVSRQMHEVLERGLAWDAASRWPDVSSLLTHMEDRPGRRRWSLVVAGALSAAAVVAGVAHGWPAPHGPPEIEAAAAFRTGSAAARIEDAERDEHAGEYPRASRALQEAFEIATAEGDDRAAADAAARLIRVAGYFHGAPAQGLRWSRHAESLLTRLRGAELIAARYHLNLGLLRSSMGEADAAVRHFHRALALRTEKLGADDPRVADVLSHIGNHAYSVRDFATARVQLTRALELTEAAYGRTDWRVAMLLDDLGNVEQLAGEITTARRRYERALRIRMVQRRGHPHLVSSWTALAYLAADTGDLVGAEIHYRRRLAVALEAWGEDHPNIARAHADLAQVLADTGRIDEAHTLFSRANVIAQSAYGPSHRDTARYNAALARIHMRRGELDLAEAAIARAEEYREAKDLRRRLAVARR